MFNIDPMSRTPVYEQIIGQTEKFIAAGILKPGDPLPSVRSLSVELSVNPNTIQKSFAELTGRGIIVSVPGKGSFISNEAPDLIREKSRARLSEFKELARELKMAGLTTEELYEAVMEATLSLVKEETNDNN